MGTEERERVKGGAGVKVSWAPGSKTPNLHKTQAQLHHPRSYFSCNSYLLTWAMWCGYGTWRFSARWTGSRGTQVFSTIETSMVAVACGPKPGHPCP